MFPPGAKVMEELCSRLLSCSVREDESTSYRRKSKGPLGLLLGETSHMVKKNKKNMKQSF